MSHGTAALPRSGLRVAIVTEYYYPHVGGICEHVHYFSREARRHGHQVDVITGRIDGTPPQRGTIYAGESATVRANGSLCRLTVGRGIRTRVRSVLQAGEYDVVHCHAPLAPSLPMIAIEEARSHVVGTFHAYHEFSLAYALGRRYFQRLLDRIDAKLPVSTAARDAVARYFDAEWTVLPNGVDTGIFRPDAGKPAHLRDGPPIILFVGRFDPRNGLEALIDAFRLLRSRGKEARLVVVGDGPARNRYRRYARGHPDITFAGRVDEGLAGYYAASDIYACPATLGSFGISVLEGMACGTPVVCYDTPGFRTVVRDGVEALMTPPGDMPALADALIRLLEDQSLRRRLGRAGRERALEYDWSRVAERILAVYAGLLGRASRAA